MSKKTILAIVGMAGSGKTEAAKYLESRGYKKKYFGDATFEEMERRGLEINEKNERQVREDLRKQYGMAAYAILALPKIEELLKTEDFIILESLYSWEEYKVVKEKYDDSFYTLAIYAPPALRYERLAKRPTRPLTIEEAITRDYVQIKNSNIAPPTAMADFLISNLGTKEELFREIDKITEEVKNYETKN